MTNATHLSAVQREIDEEKKRFFDAWRDCQQCELRMFSIKEKIEHLEHLKEEACANSLAIDGDRIQSRERFIDPFEHRA